MPQQQQQQIPFWRMANINGSVVKPRSIVNGFSSPVMTPECQKRISSPPGFDEGEENKASLLGTRHPERFTIYSLEYRWTGGLPNEKTYRPFVSVRVSSRLISFIAKTGV